MATMMVCSFVVYLSTKSARASTSVLDWERIGRGPSPIRRGILLCWQNNSNLRASRIDWFDRLRQPAQVECCISRCGMKGRVLEHHGFVVDHVLDPPLRAAEEQRVSARRLAHRQPLRRVLVEAD